MIRTLAPLFVVTFLFATGIAAQEALSDEDVALFEDEAFPILEDNCLKCHGGGDDVEGDLLLTSLAGMLRGGNRGPAIDRDDPETSLLLEMISYADEEHQMPPDGALQTWDKDGLTEWVLRGAPWPGADLSELDAEQPLLHEMQIGDPELWAFSPVQTTPVPKVSDAAWSNNPIDAFVYDGLMREELSPNAPASKWALVRRVYYDLTGLPPTPAEAREFVEDDEPGAYERLVDRLLASPRYGEKWARHWLDLVRYADSNGYERDSDKPYMWRYRDYVIDALNADKPYDRFVLEQLAGDELNDSDAATITATGYYHLGLWDDEPADPLQARYDGLDNVVDTTARVFLGLTMGCARCHDHKLDPIPQADYYRFLAFFQGVQPMQRTEGNGILTSILAADDQRAYERKVAAKREEEFQVLREQNELLEEFKAELARKQPELFEGIETNAADLQELRYRFYRNTWDSLPDFDMLKAEETGRLDHNFISTTPASRADSVGFVYEGLLNVELEGEYSFRVDANGGFRLLVHGEEVLAHRGASPRRVEGDIHIAPGLAPFRLEFFVVHGPPAISVGWAPKFANFRKSLSKDARSVLRDGDLRKLVREHGKSILGKRKVERIAELDKELKAVRDRTVEGKWAASVQELDRDAPATNILIRGNPHVPGREVAPGFPVVCSAPDPAAPSPYSREDTSGRRRQLAEWIASPENPLTARVMVNRLWQHHFGRGIVRSPNNFGAIGSRPTHPELLDWLAAEFVRGGWSLKHMHRLMLTSNTYRMASSANDAALAKDPTNDLLWRFDMRRLTAEEVRDSVLQASGSLNTQMHGPGVYPELPQEAIETSSKQKDIVKGGIWGISTPEDAARRSVYVHVKRSLLMPMLTDFDFADTDASCPERFATTQPTQALGMLNSAFVNEQSTILAKRVRTNAGPDERAQVQHALEVVTSRPALPAEIDRGMTFVNAMVDAEGLSRERAMERFCLLAFNMNEFVYLD